MKAVMVDGPKSGEVITIQDEIYVGELLCFAIKRPIDFLSPREYDPTAPLWDTAIYRRLGRVSGRDQTIDVYTFAGMQQ